MSNPLPFLNINDQIQQLTPKSGPTAIAVYYAQLKALVKQFIHVEPTNDRYTQAWALLDKPCQLDLIEVIDRYERIPTFSQVKIASLAYDEAFRQLQQKINQSVSILAQSSP